MAATTSSDQTCRGCEAGVGFSADVDGSCQPVSAPCEESGQQETRPATNTTDRECAPTTSTTSTTTTTTTRPATSTAATPAATAANGADGGGSGSGGQADAGGTAPSAAEAASAAKDTRAALQKALQEAQESLLAAEGRFVESDAALKDCLAGGSECAALQAAVDGDSAAIVVASDALAAAKKAAKKAAPGTTGGAASTTAVAAWTRGGTRAGAANQNGASRSPTVLPVPAPARAGPFSGHVGCSGVLAACSSPPSTPAAPTD